MTRANENDLRREKLAYFRNAIAEGAESGPGIDAETVLKRLEAKYRQNVNDDFVASRPASSPRNRKTGGPQT